MGQRIEGERVTYREKGAWCSGAPSVFPPCRPHSSCSTSLESLPSPRCIWERASLLCSGFSGAEEETARGTSLRAERLCSLLAPTTPLFLSVTPSLLHRQSLDGTEGTIQPNQWPPQPMRLPNGYELYNHLPFADTDRWLQHHIAPVGPTRLLLLDGGVDACVYTFPAPLTEYSGNNSIAFHIKKCIYSTLNGNI